jgi:hypothetical protein
LAHDKCKEKHVAALLGDGEHSALWPGSEGHQGEDDDEGDLNYRHTTKAKEFDQVFFENDVHIDPEPQREAITW